MKSRCKVAPLILALLLFLSACSGSVGHIDKTDGLARRSPQTDGATVYNREVFSNEYVSVMCSRIDSDGIHFEVSSKLKNNEMDFLINRVALDGIVPAEVYSETSWLKIAPQETVEMNYGAEIHATDHKLLSAVFTIFDESGNGKE